MALPQIPQEEVRATASRKTVEMSPELEPAAPIEHAQHVIGWRARHVKLRERLPPCRTQRGAERLLGERHGAVDVLGELSPQNSVERAALARRCWAVATG